MDTGKPYEKEYYATKPTKFVLHMRKNLLWQLIRFAYMNIKMTIMIVKSHQKH